MKRVLGVSLLAGMMVVGGMVLAGPASAATIDVHPGESIQAAINHASPGDVIVVHPGVYHESVVVNKDHLTLRGAGAGANGTVIEPPESSNRCLHGAAGFCVFGKKTESGFHRRTGVTVEGFEFKGFPAFGLVGFGVKDLLVQRNFGVDNGEYGLTCFNCAGISFLYNKATGAGESGFYVGDSREADALLVGNLAFGNGTTGFLFRDANVGRAKGNKAYGNCSGMQLVNTGAPNNVHGWVVNDNDVYHNDAACKGEEEGPPPFSGLGIGLFGGKNNRILHNTVWANRPTGPSAASGGIAVASSKSFGGANASDNEIRSNVLYRNKPVDILWDGTGVGNEFTKNKCKLSNPDGLCN